MVVTELLSRQMARKPGGSTARLGELIPSHGSLLCVFARFFSGAWHCHINCTVDMLGHQLPG
jgi:hypothetical protein